MKRLNLDVYEPADMIGTISKDGKVAIWTVSPDGNLAPSDNRLFHSGLTAEDPIEGLNLSVRTYNVLKRESVNFIGQVIDLYDQRGVDAFQEMRNLGQKGCDEIVGHVLRLRGQVPEEEKGPNPVPPLAPQDHVFPDGLPDGQGQL